jgi:hypothetical protein
MKTRTRNAVILLALWSLSAHASASAQNHLRSSVIGSGGGRASDGSFRALSSMGQTLVGTTADASNAIHAGFWFQNVSIVTSIEQIASETVPREFRLEQNYPNPFNPSTTITFELPKSSLVRLSVYDILGREVSLLVNEKRDAGAHRVTFIASGLSSGVYFYRMQAGDFVRTRKLLLLR